MDWDYNLYMDAIDRAEHDADLDAGVIQSNAPEPFADLYDTPENPEAIETEVIL